MNVLLNVLSLLYRVSASVSIHPQLQESDVPKQRVEQIWKKTSNASRQQTPQQPPQETVYTLMTLCLETLCCVAEMDIQLFHQLPKPAKLELLVSLGALLSAAATNNKDGENTKTNGTSTLAMPSLKAVLPVLNGSLPAMPAAA